MPRLTVSTPGISQFWFLSNRESTRFSTRESLQIILADSLESLMGTTWWAIPSGIGYEVDDEFSKGTSLTP
jgi:hypothetical protein